MIRGIGGRPYIGLDEHIDIESFKQLHPEMCRGFALAREYAKEGTWMSPGFDPKDMSYQLNWKRRRHTKISAFYCGANIRKYRSLYKNYGIRLQRYTSNCVACEC